MVQTLDQYKAILRRDVHSLGVLIPDAAIDHPDLIFESLLDRVAADTVCFLYSLYLCLSPNSFTA